MIRRDREDPGDTLTRVARRVSFRPGGLPTRIEVDGGYARGVAVLHVFLTVVDVKTNRPGETLLRRHFHHEMIAASTDEQIEAWIYNEVKTAWLHELGELYLYDGKAVHDPHPPEFRHDLTAAINRIVPLPPPSFVDKMARVSPLRSLDSDLFEIRVDYSKLHADIYGALTRGVVDDNTPDDEGK